MISLQTPKLTKSLSKIHIVTSIKQSEYRAARTGSKILVGSDLEWLVLETFTTDRNGPITDWQSGHPHTGYVMWHNLCPTSSLFSKKESLNYLMSPWTTRNKPIRPNERLNILLIVIFCSWPSKYPSTTKISENELQPSKSALCRNTSHKYEHTIST